MKKRKQLLSIAGNYGKFFILGKNGPLDDQQFKTMKEAFIAMDRMPKADFSTVYDLSDKKYQEQIL